MAERRDVVRTKKNIRRAYLELLFRKGDARITVNDILKEADISRGTFYAHYKDISDLAAHVEEELVEQLAGSMEHFSTDDLMANPQPQIEEALSLLLDHEEELRVILKKYENPRVVMKLKRVLRKAIQHGMKASDADPNAVLLLDTCLASALVDTCIVWIVEDRPVDKECLVRILENFLSGGLQKVEAGYDALKLTQN